MKKTGTAEVEGTNPDGSSYEDPEIAVTVFMVQGDTSLNCGPVLRDIVCKYFDIKINPKNQNIGNNNIIENNTILENNNENGGE